MNQVHLIFKVWWVFSILEFSYSKLLLLLNNFLESVLHEYKMTATMQLYVSTDAWKKICCFLMWTSIHTEKTGWTGGQAQRLYTKMEWMGSISCSWDFLSFVHLNVGDFLWLSCSECDVLFCGLLEEEHWRWWHQHTE